MSNPTSRQLHFNVFLFNTGHHEASWRTASARPADRLNIAAVAEIAQIAEQGLLDAVFAADFQGGRASWLEPFTLLSALAVKTRHIGLIATVDTTYNEPYHLARKFASLDHISKGRAGWNIITGAGNGSHNYSNRVHPSHATRYKIADEFVDVVTKLWDSWEDSALNYDKARGTRYDDAKIHEINHIGKRFSVKGPLSIARPPQGRPLLVQSGSSEDGREQAAKWGELIFTAQGSLAEAQAFYRDVKARAPRYGRNPDDIRIAPGLCFVLGGSDREAREREEELFSFIDKDRAIANLSDRFGLDLTRHPLDAPLNLDNARPAVEVDGVRSRHQLIVDLVLREKLSLRQLIGRLAQGRGHYSFVGTPVQLADLAQQWFENGAADGFNLMPAVFNRDLELFVDHVVPILQKRGLFRTRYEATTLRGHLGLGPVPNRYAATGLPA
ncbi:nitrilotriacetate monooxygenase [Verrucomicrobia bacterium LW23]|nr:nitrilotriacetate monooxygenase [Verrucomicrobia bacterium LW23]